MSQQPDKKLILVVDDEAHILHVVSLKLRNAGFEVVTANDGEEALDLAMQVHPDLVITDVMINDRSIKDVVSDLQEE